MESRKIFNKPKTSVSIMAKFCRSFWKSNTPKWAETSRVLFSRRLHLKITRITWKAREYEHNHLHIGEIIHAPFGIKTNLLFSADKTV